MLGKMFEYYFLLFQVDFQYSNCASPISDLLYFFFTSAKDEIKFDPTKFYELLQIYHQYLTSTLSLLKCQKKPPTLFQLNQEYCQRSFMEITSTMIFSMVVFDSTDGADIALLIGSSEASIAYRNRLMHGTRFVRAMEHFLPLWDAKGLLDPLK